jgi:hypothetical protein
MAAAGQKNCLDERSNAQCRLQQTCPVQLRKTRQGKNFIQPLHVKSESWLTYFMSTHIQKLLREKADSPLFSGKGDEANDLSPYYAGGLDCFLVAVARAAVADGIDPKIVMTMFVNGAFEILADHAAHPHAPKPGADLVLREAQRRHADLNPSQDEIEELKRDAAAFGADPIAWRASHRKH